MLTFRDRCGRITELSERGAARTMKTEQQEQESTNSLIPKVEAEEREAKRQLLKTAEEIKKVQLN